MPILSKVLVEDDVLFFLKLNEKVKKTLKNVVLNYLLENSCFEENYSSTYVIEKKDKLAILKRAMAIYHLSPLYKKFYLETMYWKRDSIFFETLGNSFRNVCEYFFSK